MTMKRKLAIVGVSILMGAGVSALAAGPFAKHPNLEAAHKLLQDATMKLTEAQKANEYDMAGHAAKAKQLINEAQTEIMEAAKAAAANRK